MTTKPTQRILSIVCVNTTNFDGYTWNLSEIVYHRMVKILANTQST